MLSYNQLADVTDSTVRSSLKRFLTTDCITDSIAETSKNKVLSCNGVNEHLSRIYELIDGSAISYLGSLTGEYAEDETWGNTGNDEDDIPVYYKYQLAINEWKG